MSDNLLAGSPGVSAPPVPSGLPPQFWDAAAGNVKLEDLLKAYQELEARLSQVAAPPPRPEDYAIDCGHGFFDIDPDINQRLHQAGFSSQQAQLLYDLAAERLLPMIQELVSGMQADREIERLTEHFGGADKWRQVSRQLLAWGKRNLPDGAVEGLATSYDGVMALYRMMKGDEPTTLKGGRDGGGPGEDELKSLMRDPRYWRDRDQSVVAKVTEGFRRLYPDN